jgi:hypothetical protein
MVVLVFIFCLTVQSASIQQSIIPEEAKWVFHFDIEKFTTTQFYSSLMNSEAAKEIKKKSEKFSEEYNVNFLEDISSITVFGLTDDEDDAVVSIKGTIDQAHLLGLLDKTKSHKELPYGDYTIHKWDRDEYGVFAGDNLILISENELAIRSALDVISGTKKSIGSTPLMSMLKQMPKNTFMTGVALDISELAKKDKTLFLKSTGMAGFTIAETGENLSARLNFSVKSSEDAENLEQVIKGLIALANMHKDEIGTKYELSEVIKISTEDKNVKIDLDFPVEELLKIILGKAKFHPLSSAAAFFSFTR